MQNYFPMFYFDLLTVNKFCGSLIFKSWISFNVLECTNSSIVFKIFHFLYHFFVDLYFPDRVQNNLLQIVVELFDSQFFLILQIVYNNIKLLFLFSNKTNISSFKIRARVLVRASYLLSPPVYNLIIAPIHQIV
jgi:hypothetical protein